MATHLGSEFADQGHEVLRNRGPRGLTRTILPARTRAGPLRRSAAHGVYRIYGDQICFFYAFSLYFRLKFALLDVFTYSPRIDPQCLGRDSGGDPPGLIRMSSAYNVLIHRGYLTPPDWGFAPLRSKARASWAKTARDSPRRRAQIRRRKRKLLRGSCHRG